MSAKAGFPTALFLIILGLSTAQGGNPPAQTAGGGPFNGGGSPLAQAGPTAPEMLPTPGEARPSIPPPPGMQEVLPPPQPEGAPPAPTVGPSLALSSWLQYRRPDCCCPIGGNGPIQTELFVRTGPSLVIGGGILNQALEAGWEFKGGGRSLFFNPDMSAAWTVEGSLSYFYNYGNAENRIPIVTMVPPPVPPGNPLPRVTPTFFHLESFHRTNANIALGREWFYTYNTEHYHLGWRYGWDVTGSLGTVRADFTRQVALPVGHRTGVLYGVSPALHTDIEIPRGCCTMVTGFRLEYEHDWTRHVLQSQNNGNLSSLSFLWNLGVRF